MKYNKINSITEFIKYIVQSGKIIIFFLIYKTKINLTKMNKVFIFFLSSTLIVIFCIVVLNTGPIINKIVGTAPTEWKDLNCLKASDDYEISKEDWQTETNENAKETKDKIAKNKKNLKIDVIEKKQCMD